MNESWNVSVGHSMQQNEDKLKCEELQLAQTEHKLTKYSSKSGKFKTMRKWRPATLATNSGHTAFMFFRALVARRHGNRGYADFKVRGAWPWLLCEEWKTHDSTWAIPQSSRAHEQFVKTHEHFSKLMSNRWKAMSKIPRENCSWGFQNPHEPSWGLMRTHEFLMRTHEFLMRSSWGKNSSRLFFVRVHFEIYSFLKRSSFVVLVLLLSGAESVHWSVLIFYKVHSYVHNTLILKVGSFILQSRCYPTL